MYPQLSVWRPIAILGGLVVATVFATSTVTVAAGDTLSEIAERHDVRVAQLIEWNGLSDPDRIFAGSSLIVSEPEAQQSTNTASSTPDIYRVTAGDTLSAIARRFGTTVAQLLQANELRDPDRIVVGAELRVSGSASPVAAPPSTSKYTVIAGDTLSGIAASHEVKLGVLARANRISDPDRLYIGQTLTIPGSDSAGSTATTVPTPAVPVATTSPPTPTPTTAPPPPATTPSAPPADPDILLSNLFVEWSNAYRVPRDLLEAIAWKESDWRSDAIGPGGHLGIAQLSPDTVEFIESGLLGREMNPLDASDGIQLAARFLRYLVDRTHSEREALAAWQQGLHSVQTNGVSSTGGAYADSVLEIRRQRA